MKNPSFAILTGDICQIFYQVAGLNQKTEAITSAAWLSAPEQILGFAPPPRGGFAVSVIISYGKSFTKLIAFQLVFLPIYRNSVVKLNLCTVMLTAFFPLYPLFIITCF
jgi:hypothetical protein